MEIERNGYKYVCVCVCVHQGTSTYNKTLKKVKVKFIIHDPAKKL